MYLQPSVFLQVFLASPEHASGSVNVPLFRSFNVANGADPLRLLKAGALLSQGVEPTEENPDFVAAFQAALGEANASSAVLCDAEGGTLETNENFPYGKESRALTAAYRLLEAGVDARLSHLEGGLNEWALAGLPFEGTGEYSIDARTPVFQKREDRSKGPNGQFWDEEGNRARRRNFSQKKSGTGMSQGMNPLDPFGTWSVEGPKMLKKLKGKVPGQPSDHSPDLGHGRVDLPHVHADEGVRQLRQC